MGKGLDDGEEMGEVSAVLLNLEHTIARAKKGLVRIRKVGGDAKVEAALTVAIEQLSTQHKRLMQATYFSPPTESPPLSP